VYKWNFATILNFATLQLYFLKLVAKTQSYKVKKLLKTKKLQTFIYYF